MDQKLISEPFLWEIKKLDNTCKSIFYIIHINFNYKKEENLKK